MTMLPVIVRLVFQFQDGLQLIRHYQRHVGVVNFETPYVLPHTCLLAAQRPRSHLPLHVTTFNSVAKGPFCLHAPGQEAKQEKRGRDGKQTQFSATKIRLGDFGSESSVADKHRARTLDPAFVIQALNRNSTTA